MKNSIRLDERMTAVASLVRQGARVLDVGTDHAYLPAHLVLTGHSPEAVASDIARGPLNNAHETVEKFGLTDKIRLFLSNGLDCVPDNCADDVIIAGMGGNLIAEIIDRAAWLKNPDIALVLQPMTHSEDVRRCLDSNGFEIAREIACVCDNRVYVAMCASYCGVRNVKNNDYFYVGELEHTRGDKKCAFMFLDKQLHRLRQRVEALKVVDPFCAEHTELISATEAIEKAMNTLVRE